MELCDLVSNVGGGGVDAIDKVDLGDGDALASLLVIDVNYSCRLATIIFAGARQVHGPRSR
jgi:hypothetical protein